MPRSVKEEPKGFAQMNEIEVLTQSAVEDEATTLRRVQ
jgi:hypothetical protein